MSVVDERGIDFGVFFTYFLNVFFVIGLCFLFYNFYVL